MIDKSHPERDPPTHTIELGKKSNLWYYVVCGVNAASGKMYLTKTNRVIDEIEFESSNSIPLGTVTLSIKDNSKKGYGFTHLRELRLWNCYDCSPGFRNFKCSANDISFSPALHCFDGLSSSTTYYDSIGKKTYDTPEVSDFNGYNIMITTNGVVYCDEKKYYNYYKNYLHFFCKPSISDLKMNGIMMKNMEKAAQVFYNNNYGENKGSRKLR